MYFYPLIEQRLLLLLLLLLLNSRRNVDSEKNPSPRWDLNPRPSVF